MNKQEETALALKDNTVMMIGSKHALETVTDRLMSLHPSAEEVGVEGMRLVAQMAMITGANPLATSGEIYVWKGPKDSLIVDLGIAYYRRLARKNDEVFWIEEARPMSDSERERYTVPEGALASLCKGYCGKKLVRLLDLGAPWEIAEARSARTSIAIVVHFEMFRKYKSRYAAAGDPLDAPRGRTWQWVCDKRAEKGFYKSEALIDTSFVDRMGEAQKLLAEFGGAKTYVESDPEKIKLSNAVAQALTEEYVQESSEAAPVIIENEAQPEQEQEAAIEDDLPPWKGADEFATEGGRIDFEDDGKSRFIDARCGMAPAEMAKRERPSRASMEKREPQVGPREQAAPEAAPEAPSMSKQEALKAAARALSFPDFSQHIVLADVGYANVPHVVQACVSDKIGFNQSIGMNSPFNFNSVDKQELANFLVERKQIPEEAN